MHRQNFNKEELTCKPLDNYSEILMFLQEPPPWRTLCREITPHSKYLLKNSEINPYTITTMETPETFCHFNPDTDDIIRHDEQKLPKTLVCHDMANGYHDDSVIDGTGNYDAYTFYNWAGIDIFCYFSHHLITIPPLSWINVGHAHGVKVIGTVITEWAEGVAFWNKILATEVEYQNFASALVAIAKTLKFDGWLLNVENKIAKPDVLLEFVQYLHKTLHQELKDPLLIWYDSVTINGSLNWQNGLNEKNKAFFDASDGFFTNYSWSESDIKSSVEAAGDRLTDLYIGIDVWGRNFYGGGQFNTAEAMKIANNYGCSLAIFAPAWTHEAMSLEKSDVNSIAMADEADKWSTFILRDRAFWGSVWPYLNTRVPCTLPFQTSFCRGQGKKRRLYGEQLYYYGLLAILLVLGGSCLRINPSDQFSPEHRLTRLFHCDFECKDSLIVCVVTKTLRNFRDQYLNIKLFMKNAKGDDLKVVLVGRNIPQTQNTAEGASGVLNLYPLNVGSEEAFRDLQKYVLINQPNFYVPIENCYEWKVWYYEINLPGSRITSINCRTGLEQGPVLLGYLGICERFRVSKHSILQTNNLALDTLLSFNASLALNTCSTGAFHNVITTITLTTADSRVPLAFDFEKSKIITL
ncbi:hypothetical protein K1T71_006953 [Dendrolimus kikuchii]|uniref:Uncharacterized protein n=1 Tax=Dendrolimus kikuchii TaxID=765133 RepID=A0ACC1CZ15_9NEOP|nr:hypothetical protein K1T71_006953 [Dendrolimus kikuchii]